jgi:3-methyladenine DNA glycosylase AlkD
MTPEKLHTDILSFCEANTNEEIIKKYSRYFKEGWNAYGLTTELLHNKVQSVLEAFGQDYTLITKTCRLLVKDPKYEATSIAYLLLKSYSKQFTHDAFKEVEKWYETGITNWAHNDVICGELMPLFFKKSLITLNDLSAWRTAPNKFQRRAVPVSIIKLLKGTDDFKPFFSFIDPMMLDPEREVHQGLGWFLREAWKKRKEETETFLLKWKNQSPRLIFQYACEKMTPEGKQRFKREGK